MLFSENWLNSLTNCLKHGVTIIPFVWSRPKVVSGRVVPIFSSLPWVMQIRTGFNLLCQLCIEHGECFLLFDPLSLRTWQKCYSEGQCYYHVLLFENVLHCIMNTNFAVTHKRWNFILLSSGFSFCHWEEKSRRENAMCKQLRSGVVWGIFWEYMQVATLLERLMVQMKFLPIQKQ